MQLCGAFCVMGAQAPPSSSTRPAKHPSAGRPLAGTVTQGGHISTEPRINERIRVPEVRLVGPAGEQVGIVAINDALLLAQEADLDLVEVAPTARPPVCKLMDYGKFKYESALKARESRKNQAQTVIKEIKLRPKIDPHDYGTKKGHVERFLKAGDKVKVTIMFRGREQSRPELGYRLLQRLAADVEELGFVEAQPKLDGRNMIMVIGPHKRKAGPGHEPREERVPARASARAARATSDRVPAAAPSSLSDEIEIPDPFVLAEEVPAAPAPVAEAPLAPSRPAAAPTRPAVSRPQQSPAASRPSSAPSRPTGPRPPATSAPRPASPRPQQPSAAPRPAPAAPRPGPAPSAPRPTAPRPTAPRPTAPRPGPATARPAQPGPRPAQPGPRPGPAPARPAAAADQGAEAEATPGR
jgi:translation initiation factor IF-3